MDHTAYGDDVREHHNGALHHDGLEHDEGEHHGDKKSVIKKVKDKAKKIKDTIKSHVGPGHDHDHDEDDDEMDHNPEVRGQHIGAKHIGERSAAVGDSHAHTPAGGGPGAYQTFDPKTTHYVPGQEETLGGSRTDTGPVLGSAENRGHVLSHTHTPGTGHSSGTEIGETTSPAAGGSPGAYQAFTPKTSPFVPVQEETLGGSRTDTGLVLGSAENRGHVVSHTHTPGIGHSSGTEDIGVVHKPKLGGITGRDSDVLRHLGDGDQSPDSLAKVGHANPQGGEEVGIAKILHQRGKIDINDESTQKPGSVVKTGQQEELFSPNLDQHQKTSTGSHNQFSPEPITEPEYDATIPISRGLDTEVKHKPESYTEALSSILGQHQKTPTGNYPEPEYDATIPEHKPESYTEKISSVASELASKAKLATDSVTSKMGYGGAHETPTHINSTVPQGPLDNKPVPGGYGETISSISTSITNTAVNAKDAVASKLGFGETHDVGSTGAGPDKGVSVKEYLAEKLKPAEEDKALSKVITDALPLYKPKENPIENPIDVGHEESESGEKKKVVIKGRVTESEEVADRLGRAEETSYDGAGPGLASPGKSVMDRIRDAAGSWFSTTDEPHLEAGDHTEANGRSHPSDVAGMQQKQGLGETQVQ